MNLYGVFALKGDQLTQSKYSSDRRQGDHVNTG